MERDEGQQNTHQTTSLERRVGKVVVIMVADVRGLVMLSGWDNGGSSSSAKVWTIRTRSHSGDGPMLVASPLLLLPLLLLLLLAEVLAVIRLVFNEEDKEGGADEGETAGARCPGTSAAGVV